MNSKNLIALIVGALVLCGGSFYGGMQYGQKTAKPSNMMLFGANGQRTFTGAVGGQRGGAGRLGGGGFVAGEIISKDDKGMTIKLSAGANGGTAAGSKIVFFASSTTIGKMTAGTADDLSVGTSVIVNGTSNSDGSLTASTVQIRPVQNP